MMLAAYFSSYYCGMRAVGGKAEYGAVISAMPVIDSISGLPISIAACRGARAVVPGANEGPRRCAAGNRRRRLPAGFACNVFWAGLGALFFLEKRDRISAAELHRKAAAGFLTPESTFPRFTHLRASFSGKIRTSTGAAVSTEHGGPAGAMEIH